MDKRPKTPADTDVLVMAVRTRANAQAAENRGMFCHSFGCSNVFRRRINDRCIFHGKH